MTTKLSESSVNLAATMRQMWSKLDKSSTAHSDQLKICFVNFLTHLINSTLKLHKILHILHHCQYSKMKAGVQISNSSTVWGRNTKISIERVRIRFQRQAMQMRLWTIKQSTSNENMIKPPPARTKINLRIRDPGRLSKKNRVKSWSNYSTGTERRQTRELTPRPTNLKRHTQKPPRSVAASAVPEALVQTIGTTPADL